MQSGGHKSMPGAWLFQKALMQLEAIDKGSNRVLVSWVAAPVALC
jgi:hypothetical protein